MKIAIIIPAHNEELFIEKCLTSLCNQTHLPDQLVVVNDNSTDATAQIVEGFVEKYDFVKLINHPSSQEHAPGSKIVQAFYRGFETLDTDYNIICKFDADLIFPQHYLEHIHKAFLKDSKIGMYAGFCYIKENGSWIKEQLTSNDHIRGPLKAYRKECFEDIGGLKKEMGWDTVDEMLARYHGWKTKTDEHLQVKHLKPTGKLYSSTLAARYGNALYKMDYGFVLSFLSLLKLAYLKKQVSFFISGIFAYLKAATYKKPAKMLSLEEGKFIRNYRWQKIKEKLIRY